MNPFVFSEVQRMLMCLYGNNPDYADTVCVLGYNLQNCKHDEIRAKFPGKRIVVYQLEQFFEGSRWFNQHTHDWLKKADEIWDYDLGNVEFLRNHGFAPKYRPMSYAEGLVDFEHGERDIDVLFYGSPTLRRAKALSSWMSASAFKYTTCWLTGVKGERLVDYLKRAKIVLNIHAFDGYVRQEQVRMFYPVINGCCIASENSKFNEFGKSIVEFPIDKMNQTLDFMLREEKWKDVSANAARVYREHCENRKPR